MRIFSESWNNEQRIREKKPKHHFCMEKVTLHTVTEASDWHFLIATLREKEEKKNKKPWNPHTTQISNVL